MSPWRFSLCCCCLVLLAFSGGALETTTAPSVTKAGPEQAAVEAAYDRLIELDNAALEEVDGWIREEQDRTVGGKAPADVTLRARIRERFQPVRDAYDNFLRQHPQHARAHLAYSSFLMEIGEEADGVRHMERSRELDPSNPAAWNNLANYFGHRGPVAKAFEYYARAIDLNPKEPIYYQNLATTVFLFRVDAAAFYKLTEAEVFEKSLELYRQAIKLDPTNFLLHSDYAQTFYGIRPAHTNTAVVRQAALRETADRAIAAWTEAFKFAGDQVQREGVRIHLARNQIQAGRYADAREHLAGVTNEVYRTIKQRLITNLDQKEGKAPPATNAPSATP